MGQVLSTLRVSGNAFNGSRGPKTSKNCMQPNTQSHDPTPQDVLLATITSPSIYESPGEGVSCGQVIRMSNEAAMGPLQIGLLDVPTEIILAAAADLPPSSLMSLSYSCSNIRNRLDVSIEHLLGERDKIVPLPRFALSSKLPKLTIRSGGHVIWSSPTMAQNFYHTERLELLSMLDRDRNIPPSKAVCSGCAGMHDRSLFSSESLAQSSRERRCLGSAGRLWICPHWIFDHNLVSTSAKRQGNHICGKKWVTVVAIDHDVTEPTIFWPVAVLRGDDKAPSKKFVEDFLARTDVSVCKHLHFSDSFVSSLYSPDCKKLWANDHDLPCPCSTCARQPQPTTAAERLDLVRGGKCESCGTNVHFNISANRNGERKLTLVVRRKIAEFRGCTDGAWIDQVNDPREFEELERKWFKATDEGIEVLRDV